MQMDPKAAVPPAAAEPAREEAQPEAQEDPAAVVELSGVGVAADAARPEARVNELRAQIERGTYEVDLEKLAARLAEELILS